MRTSSQTCTQARTHARTQPPKPNQTKHYGCFQAHATFCLDMDRKRSNKLSNWKTKDKRTSETKSKE